jgi:Cu+-exporting ATPase
MKCSHCHLKYNKANMIEDRGEYFCCNGCQGVFWLLQEQNLSSFYDKLGNNKIAPPLNISDESENYDLKYEKFIQKDNSTNQIDLIIEGIHCAACVWLNEKILFETDGIVEANINFTNHKATIVWDSTKLSLGDIIHKIQAIGYNAYPYTKSAQEERVTQEKRKLFTKIVVAIFAMMNTMMLSVAKYSGFFTGMDEQIKHVVHIAELVLATPVLFYSGSLFFKGAYYGIKNRIVNMDFLVATGAILTYLYSIYILLGGAGESYFDSVVMIISFVLIGKYFEIVGKKSATDTIDTIKSKLPLTANIIRDGKSQACSVDEIEVGDIIEVKSGEQVAVDGMIVKGEASFDESSISGESMPRFKKASDSVVNGTINKDGVVEIRATKTYEKSTMNSIVNMIENSLNSKPHIAKKANQISGYFSVSVLTLALVSFFVWYFGGFSLFYLSESSNFENAFIVFVSVIVIACPCALALATPIASVVGISELTKKGLLLKEAKFLETIAKSDVVVMDKTGTITEGNLSVVSSELPKQQSDLNMLYSLVSNSSHLVSRSIKEYLETNCSVTKLDLEEFKTVEARGVSARYQNKTILGGNSEFLEDNGLAITGSFEMTTFLFVVEDRVVATFELEDKIKQYAKEWISYLKSKKIEPIMLTGDNAYVGQRVSNECGIDEFHSKMSPTQKASFIEELRESGKSVVMVGDGMNDALSLAKSDVGISMGSGTDVAILVSDAVVLDNSLRSLKELFVLSKRTFKFIKQNLAISLLYNIVTIPLAMAGYVIPLVAALSMSLSSLIVVANSFRIKQNR